MIRRQVWPISFEYFRIFTGNSADQLYNRANKSEIYFFSLPPPHPASPAPLRLCVFASLRLCVFASEEERVRERERERVSEREREREREREHESRRKTSASVSLSLYLIP
jgi:hypothetical protein